MMRLTRFSYVAPGSVQEASSLLREHGETSMLMAGGTDLLVNIKHRIATPEHVVAIRHIPQLQLVSKDNAGWLNIGAAVTLRRLEQDPLVRTEFPALAYAAHVISTPQVRTVGTIGGNVCLDVRCNYYNQSKDWRKAIGFCMKRGSEICRVAPGGDRCWAVASADTVPVLIALKSEVSILGINGPRRIPLETLYQNDGLVPMSLQPWEIVLSVHIPPSDGVICVYQKFRLRHSFDFPLVGVAMAIYRTNDVVADARIVMTAVGSSPERATTAEAALQAQRLNASTIASAGGEVFRQAKPMDNTAGSIFHRKRMARVLLERGLREIAGLSGPIRSTA